MRFDIIDGSIKILYYPDHIKSTIRYYHCPHNYCLFHYISVCVNALPQLVNTNKIRTNHLLLLLPVFQRAGIL